MSIFSSNGVFNNKSMDIESLVESATETYKAIETLEEGVMNYTASMIPVHARETSEGTKYIVEFDMLQKLAGYGDMTITEAFNSVCYENGIIDDDAYVVMEDPDKDLEEKCCAGACADIEESIIIDNKIQNMYNDINSLIESGINILTSSEILNESSVNPEIKSKWKACQSDPECDQFSKLKDLFKMCETIPDYKFIKRRLKAYKCDDTSVKSKIDDLMRQCDKKIDDIKDEEYEKNADAKQYRRDQLAARKEAKRQAKAEKNAAKRDEE